jgi:hypothetical protein
VLPGDDIVKNAAVQQTRAITIQTPVDTLWSWLAQVGQNRGGFYSFALRESVLTSAAVLVLRRRSVFLPLTAFLGTAAVFQILTLRQPSLASVFFS